MSSNSRNSVLLPPFVLFEASTAGVPTTAFSPPGSVDSPEQLHARSRRAFSIGSPGSSGSNFGSPPSDSLLFTRLREEDTKQENAAEVTAEHNLKTENSINDMSAIAVNIEAAVILNEKVPEVSVNLKKNSSISPVRNSVKSTVSAMPKSKTNESRLKASTTVERAPSAKTMLKTSESTERTKISKSPVGIAKKATSINKDNQNS